MPSGAMRSLMVRASSTLARSTNNRMPPNSQIWLKKPGCLYHQPMPAFSSCSAMAFACSQVYRPRYTVLAGQPGRTASGSLTGP